MSNTPFPAKLKFKHYFYLSIYLSQSIDLWFLFVYLDIYVCIIVCLNYWFTNNQNTDIFHSCFNDWDSQR